ncbi:MAG: hypothetical protein JKP92_05985 [Alphaproteobacteria bacterium]|jgi:hypothetical protein|nr:hypothetical protein [Alphaproteobacteria bacterium]
MTDQHNRGPWVLAPTAEVRRLQNLLGRAVWNTQSDYMQARDILTRLASGKALTNPDIPVLMDRLSAALEVIATTAHDARSDLLALSLTLALEGKTPGEKGK